MSHDLTRAGSELIGREPELAVLETWLQRPTGAHVIFIYGESGIGKTRLWRRGIELARERGCTVLSSRPAQAEAGMRFAALGDFLYGAPGDDLDALSTPQRTAVREVLLEVGREGRADSDAAASRPVSMGFLALLKRLAGQRPAVLAVDDAQWLDEATIAVCQYAFRRLTAEPVLVFATYGTGMLGLERDPAFPCDAPEEQVTTLQLTPLADDSVRVLLSRRTLEGWPRSQVHEAARAAGGNPRLALELSRRSGTHDRDDSIVVPDWLRDWVISRLAGVSDLAMEALRGAAHLYSTSVDQLARLVGRPAVPWLEELRETGLVDVAGSKVTFVRPAVAAALRESMDADGRRSLHERLAAVTSESAERLRHLALAAAGHDDALAGTLEAASRELKGEDDALRACQLAELATRLTRRTERGELARRSLLAAECHLSLGDDVLAADIFRRVADQLSRGSGRTEVLRRLAWLELWLQGTAQSAQRLQQCLSSDVADDASSGAVRCDLSFLFLIGGDLHAARTQIDETLMDGATGTGLTTRARSLMAAVEAAAGQRRWAVTQPDQAASDPTSRWETSSAIDLAVRDSLRSDDPSTARPLLSPLARSAAGGAHWLGWLAEVECWRELWSEAWALAERGLRLAGETGEWVATVRLRYVLALVAANRGWSEQARLSAREGLEAARRSGLTPLAALNLAVMGYIELSSGSGQAALAAFEPILGAQVPGPEPGLLRLGPNGIEAQIGAGLLDHARDQLASLDACQANLSVRWLEASCARCHGALAAASGALEEAERWFERAIATEGSPPRQLELGRHLLALGAVRRRRRRREGAAAALEQARSLFTALGAESWRERAVQEIERLGRGRPGVERDSLTATQRRIADLVARGHTNKEIGQVLSLSVYTVESHLKVMFRKLGVQSRAALAFRLAEGRGRRS